MRLLRLFLAGDVMTGRGVDQILATPSDPILHEYGTHDARNYVALAERVSGPIPRSVDNAYLWGDALPELAARRPDLRIVNLETAVTTSADAWPGKGIHYRMHPANIGCLKAAGLDCAVLANNHVLDWGEGGLRESLAVLHSAGIATAGAGEDGVEAVRPTIFDMPGKGRVLLLGATMENAGTPRAWAARNGHPGVCLLSDFSSASVATIAARVRTNRQPGDLVVLSVHWGENWGYALEPGQQRFAHRLIDEAGVDLIFGHSSHHVKGIECHRGRLILHGCGDFVNDYEGIGGQEHYAPDLALMFFVTVHCADGDAGDAEQHGRLADLTLVPLRRWRFKLVRASEADVKRLAQVLEREGRSLGTRVTHIADGELRMACTE
ncbi:CapA family protein [Dyella subtropica]|uniref:CapA family protein n=1 Tax=Dyella subtropica TaxID=2992127 RepID=UPI00225695D3|nr:CapA family protein [Dyella subtropica]